MSDRNDDYLACLTADEALVAEFVHIELLLALENRHDSGLLVHVASDTEFTAVKSSKTAN